MWHVAMVFVEQPWLYRAFYHHVTIWLVMTSFDVLGLLLFLLNFSKDCSFVLTSLKKTLLAFRIAEKFSNSTNKILILCKVFFLPLACWPKKWVSFFLHFQALPSQSITFKLIRTFSRIFQSGRTLRRTSAAGRNLPWILDQLVHRSRFILSWPSEFG